MQRTVFFDPRRGVERRASVSRKVARKLERRRAAKDRRGHNGHDGSRPWWLMRTYVTAEKFFDKSAHGL